MKQLREFLNRQIEAFLNHEFGPEMQNMTPTGVRRMLWTPEHTARLAGHLAGNWEMVEEALRVQQNARPLPKGHGGLHQVTCTYCPVRFGCGCPNPDDPHMCMGCDTAAEESKVTGKFPISGSS